jgi:general secretion pathway protein I
MASIRAEAGIDGFTLLEAMVALVIVSLGMMAVNTQLNRYAAASVYAEQKTLASWIATNKITELSVASTWPELGDSDEEIEFAGRMWQCRVEVSETPVENLRRVDVEIALADNPERVVHKVSGILEPPAPGGFLPLRWIGPPRDGGGRGRAGRPREDEGDRERGDEGGRERGDERGREPGNEGARPLGGPQ